MTIDCDTRIGVAKWEDDEFVITLNGTPTGHTCTRDDALRIREWLVSACLEEARRRRPIEWKCLQCGVQIPETDDYCEKCGNQAFNEATNP